MRINSIEETREKLSFPSNFRKKTMTMMNGIVVVARIRNLPNWDILVVDPEESFYQSTKSAIQEFTSYLLSSAVANQTTNCLKHKVHTFVIPGYLKTGTKETKNFHSYDLARDI